VRRRVGNPQVELICSRAVRADFISPPRDLVRLHQHRAAGAESAGVGHGDRKRGSGCSRHGREKNGNAQGESRAKCRRASYRCSHEYSVYSQRSRDSTCISIRLAASRSIDTRSVVMIKSRAFADPPSCDVNIVSLGSPMSWRCHCAGKVRRCRNVIGITNGLARGVLRQECNLYTYMSADFAAWRIRPVDSLLLGALYAAIDRASH
jgi:hypothetical protein